MTTLKIYCKSCCGTWEIYERNIKSADAHICPHCGAEIDRQIWDNSVLTAWAAVNDANIEIAKDSAGYNKPDFCVSVTSRKGRNNANR